MLYYFYILIVYIVLSVSLNMLMIGKCLNEKCTLKTTLLISMGIGDILQCFTSYVMEIMIGANDFPLWNSNLCISQAACVLLFGFSSISHFLALTFERMLRIVNPILISDKYHVLVPLLSWVYPIIWTVIPFLGWGDYRRNVILVPRCAVLENTALNRSYMAILILFGFLLPFIINICFHLKSRRAMSNNVSTLISCSVVVTNDIVNTRQRQIIRFDFMTTVMSLAFVIAWFPYAMCSLYYVVTNKFPPHWAEISTPIVAKAGVFLNPIIYLYWYSDLKASIHSWIRSKCLEKEKKKTLENSQSNTTNCSTISNNNEAIQNNGKSINLQIKQDREKNKMVPIDKPLQEKNEIKIEIEKEKDFELSIFT